VISIRRATAGDQSIIRRLVLREGLDPTTLRWLNFIVAQDEAGTVAGFAQIKPYKDCREFGSLVVRSEFRRQGVGAMLIEHALAGEAGDVYLLCGNHRVPYYRKFGFVEIEREQAPRTLRRKLSLVRPFSIFGVKVACMRRDASTGASEQAPRQIAQ
jgi:N-acetylglutamate synthase-like GNAT family acetyltransferase